MVPTSVFNAVYDATANRAAVYITLNTAEHTYAVTSVTEATARLGIDPFPGISAEARNSSEELITASKKTSCD